MFVKKKFANIFEIKDCSTDANNIEFMLDMSPLSHLSPSNHENDSMRDPDEMESDLMLGYSEGQAEAPENGYFPGDGLSDDKRETLSVCSLGKRGTEDCWSRDEPKQEDELSHFMNEKILFDEPQNESIHLSLGGSRTDLEMAQLRDDDGQSGLKRDKRISHLFDEAGDLIGSQGEERADRGMQAPLKLEPERRDEKNARERPSDWESESGGYSSADLDRLFAFFEAYHLDFDTLEERFEELNRKNKVLLCLHLKKIFKLKTKPKKHMPFEEFRQRFVDERAKKRNEEKIKIVYKHTLKALEKHFEYRNTSFIQQHRSARFKKFLVNKKSRFYLYLFKETITGGQTHEDLLMDVLFERVTFKRPDIEEGANWTRCKKGKAMKKISTSVRLLIKRDSGARSKLLDFINYREKPNGLVGKMREEIIKKLKKKKKFWTGLLRRNGFDFEKFRSAFTRTLNSSQYKNPWMIRDIREAIDHCRSEMEHPDDTDLMTEFSLIQKKHYTNA